MTSREQLIFPQFSKPTSFVSPGHCDKYQQEFESSVLISLSSLLKLHHAGFVPRPPTRLVFDDPGDGSGQGGSSISGSDISNSEKRHAPLPPERSERRSSKSQLQDPRDAHETKVSEFEPWNLGQEPSVPSRKSQQSKASSGGDSRLSTTTPPRRQSYTPPDTIMVTDQVTSCFFLIMLTFRPGALCN